MPGTELCLLASAATDEQVTAGSKSGDFGNRTELSLGSRV